MRALMREATQLKNNLPIHPNSSILVRQVRMIPLFFTTYCDDVSPVKFLLAAVYNVRRSFVFLGRNTFST